MTYEEATGSNRTFMELKLYYLNGTYGVTRSSNRTFMELKSSTPH